MTHKHDVYFSPHSTEAHNLVMQIADYCNKRGIWYKISESTLGIGIEYGGNVAYVIKTEPTISKMEQVEDEQIASKLTDVGNSMVSAVASTMEQLKSKLKDEPQTDFCEFKGDMCTDRSMKTDCAWK